MLEYAFDVKKNNIYCYAFCHPFHQSQTEKNLQLIKYENILVLKIIQAHAFVT